MDYIVVKKPKKRRFRSEESIEEISLTDIIRKRKEELTELEKFLEEQKKLNKKDDPKPKGHAFTFTEGLLLAFLFQYTLGPMISAALKAQGLQ